MFAGFLKETHITCMNDIQVDLYIRGKGDYALRSNEDTRHKEKNRYRIL